MSIEQKSGEAFYLLWAGSHSAAAGRCILIPEDHTGKHCADAADLVCR